MPGCEPFCLLWSYLLAGAAGDRRGGVARTVDSVSLELPGWVVDAFNLVGLPWPGIDEDQLRGWAADLRQFSGEITALSGQSRSAVAELAARSRSAFTTTLAANWEHYHGVITGLRGPMEVFAAGLDVAADAVVAQKGAVIGAAVALAGAVIATQGEALVTFGAAEAEVPEEVMVTRLVVKAALQELEGQLLGTLVARAAAEISAHLGGAIARLVSGGGQAAAEAVALKADYGAMQTLATTLNGHGARVDHTAAASYRRAATRRLETGGPGGGWREVATAVGQAVLRVLVQAFRDLGHTICAIVLDTIKFLRTATARLAHTDAALAGTIRATIRAGGGRVAAAAQAGGQALVVGGKKVAARARELIPAVGDPVDAATGAVIMYQVDAELAGVLPLVLERAYGSSYRAGRWFGPGWASSLDQRLVTGAAGVIYTAADGRLLCYPHPPAGGGQVWPAAGPRWPLRRDGETYLITDPADGRTLAFTRHGGGGDLLLDRISDRNGNRITFGYGPGGAPQRVEHSGGYRVDVTTSGGRVSALSLARAARRAGRAAGAVRVRRRAPGAGGQLLRAAAGVRLRRCRADDRLDRPQRLLVPLQLRPPGPLRPGGRPGRGAAGGVRLPATPHHRHRRGRRGHRVRPRSGRPGGGADRPGGRGDPLPA